MEGKSKKKKRKHLISTDETTSPSKSKKIKKHVQDDTFTKDESLSLDDSVKMDLKQDIHKKSKKKKGKQTDNSLTKIVDNCENECGIETQNDEGASSEKGGNSVQVVEKKKKKKDKKKKKNSRKEEKKELSDNETEDKVTTDVDIGENGDSVTEKTNKQKQEKKKKQKIKGSTRTPVDTAPALSYLKLWSENRSEWKFQKVRQVWLLQHLYEAVKIPDDVFPTLMKYLINLKGRAREETLAQAQKIVDSEDSREEEESTEIENAVKYNRAREIIQMLS